MVICPFCSSDNTHEVQECGFQFRKCANCGEEFDQSRMDAAEPHDPEGLTREEVPDVAA